VHRGAGRVDRHRDRHVLHVEFVDRFHAEVGEADHPRPDGLRHQVGGAAHGHQVGRLVVLDRLDRGRAALGLADHRDQAGLRQHHFGELVHARGRGRAGRADDFVAHRIDRADVVDDAVGEVDRQLLALGQHVGDALVRGVAAGQHLAVEQQGLARLPAATSSGVSVFEVDALRPLVSACQVTSGQSSRLGGSSFAGPEPSRWKCDVAGRGAVRDHRHRQVGGMRRVVEDLDVEHGRQAAQALGADAQRVDLFISSRRSSSTRVSFRPARLVRPPAGC
jgi:hypothetical protein